MKRSDELLHRSELGKSFVEEIYLYGYVTMNGRFGRVKTKVVWAERPN
jgi:hypothetical protein